MKSRLSLSDLLKSIISFMCLFYFLFFVCWVARSPLCFANLWTWRFNVRRGPFVACPSNLGKKARYNVSTATADLLLPVFLSFNGSPNHHLHFGLPFKTATFLSFLIGPINIKSSFYAPIFLFAGHDHGRSSTINPTGGRWWHGHGRSKLANMWQSCRNHNSGTHRERDLVCP